MITFPVRRLDQFGCKDGWPGVSREFVWAREKILRTVRLRIISTKNREGKASIVNRVPSWVVRRIEITKEFDVP